MHGLYTCKRVIIVTIEERMRFESARERSKREREREGRKRRVRISEVQNKDHYKLLVHFKLLIDSMGILLFMKAKKRAYKKNYSRERRERSPHNFKDRKLNRKISM